MHDVLEGLMAVINAVVVKSCVRSDAISLKVMNCRIANFCFARLTSVINLGAIFTGFCFKRQSFKC